MIMVHRRVRHLLFALIALSPVGCTHWIALTPPSEHPHESVARSIPSNERVPFVIDSLHLTRNGAAQHFPVEMERRLAGTVQDTRLFSGLVPFGEVSPFHDGKTVTARLALDETIDPHAGETAWTGFLIGASMFLLAPVVELDYDYAAHAVLEIERWDGQVKRYEAQAQGSAHYNVFGATPVMIDELKGQVLDSCLAYLTDQLVRDTSFYFASSAPLQEPVIRSVTVRSRKPGSVPTAPSAIAASAPSRP